MVVNLNKILQKQRDHKFSGKDRWVSRGVVGGPLIAAASWRCNDALMQRHALHQRSFPCNTAEGGVGRSRSRWLSSGHRPPLPPSNQTALHSTMQLFNALCVANSKLSLFDCAYILRNFNMLPFCNVLLTRSWEFKNESFRKLFEVVIERSKGVKARPLWYLCGRYLTMNMFLLFKIKFK